MNRTQLEREGYRPHVSLFDDGFPNVPTKGPWTKWDWMEAVASVVMLGIGLAAFVLAMNIW